MNLELIETKGDVRFFKDEKGKQFQKLAHGEPYKVRDGKMTYKHLNSIGKYDIKYNNNGVHGFSVWKGKKCLEDNMWVYADADRMARTFRDGDKIAATLS